MISLHLFFFKLLWYTANIWGETKPSICNGLQIVAALKNSLDAPKRSCMKYSQVTTACPTCLVAHLGSWNAFWCLAQLSCFWEFHIYGKTHQTTLRKRNMFGSAFLDTALMGSVAIHVWLVQPVTDHSAIRYRPIQSGCLSSARVIQSWRPTLLPRELAILLHR